jgi:hypothetical protein
MEGTLAGLLQGYMDWGEHRELNELVECCRKFEPAVQRAPPYCRENLIRQTEYHRAPTEFLISPKGHRIGSGLGVRWAVVPVYTSRTGRELDWFEGIHLTGWVNAESYHFRIPNSHRGRTWARDTLENLCYCCQDLKWLVITHVNQNSSSL